MKRAATGKSDLGGDVIDLTAENSQESDEEPEKKKAKGEGKVNIKKTAHKNEKQKKGGGNSNEAGGKKHFSGQRGFTAANGFHIGNPSGGWGNRSNQGFGGKNRFAGMRQSAINNVVAQARPPPLMNMGAGNDFEVWRSVLFPSPDVFSHPSERFRVGLCPDPDNFHGVVDRLCCPVDVQAAVAGAGRWSSLTRGVAEQFNFMQQGQNTMNQKILLWKEIYRAVRTEVDCGIFVFGSTFNGFGGSGCDIDMCMFPQGHSMGDKQWLTVARRLLNKHCKHFIRGGIELINAKVPILKFFDREGGLEVDLSVNNPTSIRNTHLLYCYSQADYRVRPLVLAVKMWAKDHKINEARFQTLSSYTITLMVLHYLQCGVTPPVIPCLHRLNPQIFNSNSDFFNLPYTASPFNSSNTMSLGELLVGFFRYYTDTGSFNPNMDVGSIRCGSVLTAGDCERFARLHKLGPGQWSARLLMEEPFDRTNAARAVCSDQKWDLIASTLEATYAKIQRSEIARLTLEDLSSKKLKMGTFV